MIERYKPSSFKDALESGNNEYAQVLRKSIFESITFADKQIILPDGTILRALSAKLIHLFLTYEIPATPTLEDIAAFLYGKTTQESVEFAKGTIAYAKKKLQPANLTINSWVVPEEKTASASGRHYCIELIEVKAVSQPALQEKLPVPLETLRLARAVNEMIPKAQVILWSKRRLLSPEEYQSQVLGLAAFVQDVSQGKVMPPSFLQIMNAPRDEKYKVAASQIRYILAQAILEHQAGKADAWRLRWGAKIRELMDWLGVGSREHIERAVDALPDTERALVIDRSSISLLEYMGYLDIDECNEKRLAAYLQHAAFEPDQEKKDEALELLLTKIYERSDSGEINPSIIVDVLFQLSRHNHIFETLIETARFRALKEELMMLFLSHYATEGLGRKIERDLRYGEDDEFIPRKKRET